MTLQTKCGRKSLTLNPYPLAATLDLLPLTRNPRFRNAALSYGSSVVRALNWYLGGHGFDSCRGLRFFLCSMLVTNGYFIFIIFYLPSLKFTILVLFENKILANPSYFIYAVKKDWKTIFCSNFHGHGIIMAVITIDASVSLENRLLIKFKRNYIQDLCNGYYSQSICFLFHFSTRWQLEGVEKCSLTPVIKNQEKKSKVAKQNKQRSKKRKPWRKRMNLLVTWRGKR